MLNPFGGHRSSNPITEDEDNVLRLTALFTERSNPLLLCVKGENTMSENAENKTPFSQQIAYINKGTLDAELTETLAMIIQAVRETRKKVRSH